MKEEMVGLEPISEEELNDYYGWSNCSNAGNEGAYDPDCCWHDCKKKNGRATKFWTAWS